MPTAGEQTLIADLQFGRVVVKALCYKPEGCGFDISGVYSASELSTGNVKIIIMFLGSKVWRVGRADNLTTISEPIV
jgi:hypothetical protein